MKTWHCSCFRSVFNPCFIRCRFLLFIISGFAVAVWTEPSFPATPPQFRSVGGYLATFRPAKKETSVQIDSVGKESHQCLVAMRRKLMISLAETLVFLASLGAVATLALRGGRAVAARRLSEGREDGGGLPGRLPHLQLGAGSRLARARFRPPRSRRMILPGPLRPDFTAVVFDYRGLAPQGQVVLRLTFFRSSQRSPLSAAW